MQIFVGHDWAEEHHDIELRDDQGRRLARARVPEGLEGVAGFHALVGAYAEDPAEVVVATETDRGLFVGALVAAGYEVRGEPAVGGPLPGAPRHLGGQVRSR